MPRGRAPGSVPLWGTGGRPCPTRGPLHRPPQRAVGRVLQRALGEARLPCCPGILTSVMVLDKRRTGMEPKRDNPSCPEHVVFVLEVAISDIPLRAVISKILAVILVQKYFS